MKIYLTIILLFSMVSQQHFADNYPIPENTKERLFFIQRNLNSNTIVYDAAFDQSGNLLEKDPVSVYYISYAEQGQISKLTKIEKMFAYGVRSRQVKDQENEFNIKLVAYKDKEFMLKQLAPFKAEIHTMIGNQLSKLNHIYILADNKRLWPVVKYVEIFGIDVKTNQETYEKIIINE